MLRSEQQITRNSLDTVQIGKIWTAFVQIVLKNHYKSERQYQVLSK